MILDHYKDLVQNPYDGMTPEECAKLFQFTGLHEPGEDFTKWQMTFHWRKKGCLTQSEFQCLLTGTM